MTELPHDIFILENLKKLNISNNPIKKITPFIGRLKPLRILIMENNKFSYLPKEIGNLTNLIKLDLSSNKCLKYIPKEIGKLINLSELNITGNESLKKLPEEIGNLTNLDIINIDYKYSIAKYIDDEFDTFTILNLCHRGLKEIPFDIIKIINLEKLNISNNQIIKLPPLMATLKKLKIIDMRGNQLEEFPDFLYKISHFEKLIVDRIPSFVSSKKINTIINLLFIWENRKN